MKRFVCIVFAVVALALALNAEAKVSPRRVVLFNNEWKYAPGDRPERCAFAFDDRKWDRIGLPHSFSIPYFMSKDFQVGYGWYRKHFKLNSAEAAKCLFLEFDGVFQEAEAYVNGVLAGHHVGGYTGFCIDISSQVKAGDNVVAVRVNNLWKPDVAPRAGEYIYPGGIYRDVRLVIKSRSCIDWYGTSVTTPGLAKTHGCSSRVAIEANVSNHTDVVRNYTLVSSVIDAKGYTIATASKSLRIGPHAVGTCRDEISSISRPDLWSPEHPALYTLQTSLYCGKTLCDVDKTTFGFRWFEWTADRGFSLNGKHRYLRGSNIHQDMAGWCDAMTDSAIYRDVRWIRDAGFDLVRGTTYPHAPATVNACDEMGLCYWADADFWGIGGFQGEGYWDAGAYPVREKDQENFDRNVLQQLREMIRIFRNHPSIIIWSMCNEVFFSDENVMPRVHGLLRKMVEETHSLDSTRPAAIGGAQRPLGKNRIDTIGDVAGYNGDGCTIADFQHPSLPSLITEYGSVTSRRPGEYAPGWGDLGKNDGWKGFPWRSGQALWCTFDHGSLAGDELARMGIIDYFRIPKRAWYWYRQAYRHIAPPEWPQSGIAARLVLASNKTKAIKSNGTEDVQLTVTVCDAKNHPVSNSPTVCLRVVSGPGQFPTGPSIVFQKDSDIAIADGQAAIAFRSYYAGTTVIEASSPGLVPARLTLTFTGDHSYREGVTPPLSWRPYRRYHAEKNTVAIQTFGVNNPTFASSSFAASSSGLAADGNPATYWRPADDDLNPSWTVDTEKGLELQEVQIDFPQEYVYRYIVETSDDRKSWRILLNECHATVPEKSHTLSLSNSEPKPRGRFVRIRFLSVSSGHPIGLSEVRVKGIVEQ